MSMHDVAPFTLRGPTCDNGKLNGAHFSDHGHLSTGICLGHEVTKVGKLTMKGVVGPLRVVNMGTTSRSFVGCCY